MRIRFGLATLSAATIFAAPALAQDYTGNVNPAQWASSLTMEQTIRAQSRQQARANRASRDRPTSAAQTCRELPQYRRALGSENARVRKLTALCREAGYR